MSLLHIHTFDFKDQPAFNIRQMKTVYEWDACKGTKPQAEVTLEDLRLAFANAKGDDKLWCLDFEETQNEPGFLNLNPRYVTLDKLETEIRRAETLSRAMWALNPSAEALTIYGLWHPVEYYPDKKRDDAAMALRSALRRTDFLTHTALVYYRIEDAEAWDTHLNLNIQNARSLGKPLHFWYSPWVNSPTRADLMVDPAMIEADIKNISRRLSIANGDRIVWWGPRTKQVGDRWEEIPWSPKWKWVEKFKRLTGA